MANVSVNASPNDVDFNDTDNWVEVTMLGDLHRQYIPAPPPPPNKWPPPGWRVGEYQGLVFATDDVHGFEWKPGQRLTAVEPCVCDPLGGGNPFAMGCGQLRDSSFGIKCRCQKRREREAERRAAIRRTIAERWQSDWYWYVGLAAVVALGVGSAWI